MHSLVHSRTITGIKRLSLEPMRALNDFLSLEPVQALNDFFNAGIFCFSSGLWDYVTHDLNVWIECLIYNQ